MVNRVKFTDFGAVFPHKVTYHDSCAGLREYGLKAEGRLLLSKVKDIELVEMKEREVCCGFGGVFSVKHEAISTAMAQQKNRKRFGNRSRIYCFNRSFVFDAFGRLYQ